MKERRSFSGHAHTWDTFARAMCEQFHVVALDQRGHGDSDWSREGADTADDHARDVAAVHERLRLGPVTLIGLSMGGRNAIAHTASHPSAVEKLVIVDIGPDIAPGGAEPVRRMAAEAPEEFASVEHGVKKLPNGRYAWKYDRFLRDQRRRASSPPADLWPAIRQIKAPTPILRGSESDVFSPETATMMQELIPGSRFLQIPGAGHSIPAGAPEGFERAVRKFLVPDL